MKHMLRTAMNKSHHSKMVQMEWPFIEPECSVEFTVPKHCTHNTDRLVGFWLQIHNCINNKKTEKSFDSLTTTCGPHKIR